MDGGETSIESLCKQSSLFANLRLKELLVFMSLTQSPFSEWDYVCQELKAQTGCEISSKQCDELYRLLRVSAMSSFECVKCAPQTSQGSTISSTAEILPSDEILQDKDPLSRARSNDTDDPDDVPPSPLRIRSQNKVVKRSPMKSKRVDIRSFQLEQVALSIARNKDVLLMDRRNRFTTYKNCLLGNELIDWLVKTGTVLTRGSAQSLGQCLLEKKILTHIRGDPLFKDAPSMYIFKVELFEQQLTKACGMPSALRPASSQSSASMKRSTSLSDTAHMDRPLARRNTIAGGEITRGLGRERRNSLGELPPRAPSTERRISYSASTAPLDVKKNESRQRSQSPHIDTGVLTNLFFAGSPKDSFPHSLSALGFGEQPKPPPSTKAAKMPSLSQLLSNTVAFHVPTPRGPPLPSPSTLAPSASCASSSSSASTASLASSLPSVSSVSSLASLSRSPSFTNPSPRSRLHLNVATLDRSPRIVGLDPLLSTPSSVPPLDLASYLLNSSKLINRALFQALSMLSLSDLASAAVCSRSWKELVHQRFLLDPTFWDCFAQRGFEPRDKCWTRLAGSSQNVAEVEVLYDQLLAMDAHFYDSAIRADVGRCGGLLPEEFTEPLFNVLRAYSIHDSQVGYCQGMMMLVSLLLSVLRVEWLAFMVYKVMMVRLDVRSLYTKDFPRLTTCFYEFDKAVQHCLPSLHSLFKQHSIAVHMFCLEWFLTLFVSVCPAVVVARLWDMFLVSGWNIFFKAGVAILKQSLNHLLSLPPGALAMSLQKMSSSPSFKADEIVPMALRIRLPALEN